MTVQDKTYLEQIDKYYKKELQKYAKILFCIAGIIAIAMNVENILMKMMY